LQVSQIGSHLVTREEVKWLGLMIQPAFAGTKVPQHQQWPEKELERVDFTLLAGGEGGGALVCPCDVAWPGVVVHP